MGPILTWVGVVDRVMVISVGSFNRGSRDVDGFPWGEVIVSWINVIFLDKYRFTRIYERSTTLIITNNTDSSHMDSSRSHWNAAGTCCRNMPQ